MKTIKNLGLATAVVLALFLGFAAPAGATNLVDIQSGTLTTALGNFDLGADPLPQCPEQTSTLRFTTTAAPNNWTLSGAFGGLFELPAGSGNIYRATFTILAGSGGAWGPLAAGTNALTGVVGVRVDIRAVSVNGSPVNCVGVATCTITGAFALQAGSAYKSAGTGGVGPGLPTTVAGDLVTITATTAQPLVVSNCAPPFNSVGGTNASLTNLQAVIL
jgi:hypothetical protein